MSLESAPAKSSPKPRRLIQDEDIDDEIVEAKQPNSPFIKSNPNVDKSFEELSNALRNENGSITVHPKMKGPITISSSSSTSNVEKQPNLKNSQNSNANNTVSSSTSPSLPRNNKLTDQELRDREVALKIQKEEEEEMKKERESFKLSIKTHQDSLASKDWYFGKIDRESSEAILLACKEDTFLVRDSSIPFHYAISLFNFKEQNVQHSLIVPLGFILFYFFILIYQRLWTKILSITEYS